MDESGEDLTIHLRRLRDGTSAIDARRERERKGISVADKRAMRRQSRKDEQLNMRVTAEFKSFLAQQCAATGLKQVAYVERAVRAYAARRTRKCVEIS